MIGALNFAYFLETRGMGKPHLMEDTSFTSFEKTDWGSGVHRGEYEVWLGGKPIGFYIIHAVSTSLYGQYTIFQQAYDGRIPKHGIKDIDENHNFTLRAKYGIRRDIRREIPFP